MKKGFTLIELLAVIIILAVIALIATPVVLKVVDNAKESARKSSVAGYADTVKLAINEKMFENNGTMPTIDSTFLSNLTYQGETVTCNEVLNSNNYGVILKECQVGINTNLYCFASGKVYNCDDTEFVNIYNNLDTPIVEDNRYKDSSGANYPELVDKILPVYYDGTNWIYADIYNDAWYDYDNKQWANAVILVNSPSKTYNVGDAILMDDIGEMYVWIPRYKYTIFNGTGTTGISEQEITVQFESGTDSTGTVSCTDAINQTDGSGNIISETCTDTTNGSVTNGTSTYTHPAFNFDNTNLTGFWVGKFEISTTDTTCLSTPSATNCNNSNHTILIKPNSNFLKYIDVNNLFINIQNITDKYNISSAESHMIKNMEWGAVAYLTQSKYGRCTDETCSEVMRNNVFASSSNNYTGYTGCAADSTASAIITTCASTNTYETVKGVLASTTGNIYGIYDMSGGANEYVMANMADATGIFYPSSSNVPSNLETKYYDFYTYSANATTQSGGKLGDATKETLKTYGTCANGAWYSDYAYYLSGTGAWALRGGHANYGIGAGIFSFDRGNGGSSAYYNSSRAIIINQ